MEIFIKFEKCIKIHKLISLKYALNEVPIQILGIMSKLNEN